MWAGLIGCVHYIKRADSVETNNWTVRKLIPFIEFTIFNWLFLCFVYLEQGRKKRHHVRVKYNLCSKADKQKLNSCLKKLGGFNFRQKCTYKTAFCHYIVDCFHSTKSTFSFYDPEYTCNTVVHKLNVEDVCCQAICWSNLL